MNSLKHKNTKLGLLWALFTQAFQLKGFPFPYLKALKAGIASALPVLIGILAGRFDYGLLASLGGFTFLYVFNQPYAQRARRIFFVMLGISLSVMLGTLLAPHPYISAIVMGLVAAIPIFIFGALRITGPSAIFFILTYAMATAMPADPSLAPLRGGLVLLGGALAWILGMTGWFVQPHRPETGAVKRVYLSLAEVLESLGTERFNAARHQTVVALKETESILIGAYHGLAKTNKFKRLFLLNEQANAIFLEAIELSLQGKSKLPPEWQEYMRVIAYAIEHEKTTLPVISHPEPMVSDINNLFLELREAGSILNEPADRIQREVTMLKPSLRQIFLGSFDKNSIVFLTALRSGIVVFIAAIIAMSFEFSRSYWVPLSAAAVMAGSTFVGTFHRAVQRTLGTIVGILIASLILSTVHNEYVVVLIILGLTFLTETFIVRNYGIAAMFFTPAALVMAEYSTQTFNFPYFASVRIVDILVGSLIGLAGTILIGNRLASSVLDHYIAKTLRSQAQFLIQLFSANNANMAINENRQRAKMLTNLNNLVSVYHTALGELQSSRQRLESTWPIIFSTEQLGYYLDASLKYYKRPVLSDSALSQLLYIFETMAMAADSNALLTIKEVPEIEGFSKIRNEIAFLQKVVHMRGAVGLQR
jgi:uncharacterized membrane protein YccC